MKVTIYTTTSCEYSKQEKAFLTTHNIAFEEKNLEANREFLTEMLAVSNNFAGTPVTKIEKDSGEVKVLKGFTESEIAPELGISLSDSTPVTSTPIVPSEPVHEEQTPTPPPVVEPPIAPTPQPPVEPETPAMPEPMVMPDTPQPFVSASGTDPVAPPTPHEVDQTPLDNTTLPPLDVPTTPTPPVSTPTEPVEPTPSPEPMTPPTISEPAPTTDTTPVVEPTTQSSSPKNDLDSILSSLQSNINTSMDAKQTPPPPSATT